MPRFPGLATSSEVTFKPFDIEFSTDGKQYATIGQVMSKSEPSGSSYSFSTRQESQKGYYRLKMVDVDGKYTFSSNVTVSTACSLRVISVSPNPTSGNIMVNGINSVDQIKILNLFGQTVQSMTSGGYPPL